MEPLPSRQQKNSSIGSTFPSPLSRATRYTHTISIESSQQTNNEKATHRRRKKRKKNFKNILFLLAGKWNICWSLFETPFFFHHQFCRRRTSWRRLFCWLCVLDLPKGPSQTSTPLFSSVTVLNHPVSVILAENEVSSHDCVFWWTQSWISWGWGKAY